MASDAPPAAGDAAPPPAAPVAADAAGAAADAGSAPNSSAPAPAAPAAEPRRVYGTEEDKVNCSFYLKTGACRHGDRCQRQHVRPTHSETIMLPHMWLNPYVVAAAAAGGGATPESMPLNERTVLRSFEDFYEDVWIEMSAHGEVDEIAVCDNYGEHLVGNVYVHFYHEDDADAARRAMHGRWFDGRQLVCEFSPVTDFRDASCRQLDEGTCNFGGQCSFIHWRRVSRSQEKYLRDNQEHAGERSRDYRRGRSSGGGGGRDRGSSHDRRDRGRRSRDRDREYERSRDYGSHDRDRASRRRGDDDRGRDRGRDRSRDRERDGGSGRGGYGAGASAGASAAYDPRAAAEA